jgi:hypothetical protein
LTKEKRTVVFLAFFLFRSERERTEEKMSERPIRQTARQLTSEPSHNLTAFYKHWSWLFSCLCGPPRPRNPLVYLDEDTIPGTDSVPVYE